MKERIRHHFNQSVSAYDEVAYLQKKVAVALAKKLPTSSPQKIMEIGCGTGIFTEELLAVFPKAKFFLFDLSPKMVEKCRQRFYGTPQLTVACQDVETMTIPNHFDLIVSSMTFHWLQHLPGTLAKLRDQLTDEGCLIFSLVGKNSFPEWKNLCHELGMAHGILDFPCVTQLQQTYPSAVFTTEIFVEHYRDARDFLQTLKKLGAHTPNFYYQSQPVSQMRTLIKRFDHIYPKCAPITYEIIYGWLHK